MRHGLKAFYTLLMKNKASLGCVHTHTHVDVWEEQANTAKEACWLPQISALKEVWPSPKPVLKAWTLPEEFAENKNCGTPSWLYWKSGIKVESWPLTVQPRMWEIDTLSNAFTARLRVWGKKSCLSHLIVLLHDGVWMPSLQLSFQAHSVLCST